MDLEIERQNEEIEAFKTQLLDQSNHLEAMKIKMQIFAHISPFSP